MTTTNTNDTNANNTTANAAIANRWIIVIAVMSATLMQVLDTTIVNVALPHMQGSLNAAPDQISWTLTSYLVASAIIMPLTGYFSDRLGRKKYLLWCIGGFTIASALCGMANSLAQIVSFRLLQGVFGAALVPLSQAILVGIYPPKELGKAMAIWGTGVMVGPILGPTLGGYLTDLASWRWTFYINVPVGVMALVLVWLAVPDTLKKQRTFDWLGFVFMAAAIGAVQYLLDRGNQEDWFNAHSIQIAALIAACGLIGFLIYNYFHRGEAVFDLRIFKDRNFIISSLLFLVMGVGVYGSMVILPLFLEGLLNYSVFDTGMMMAPRAVSVMFSMIIMGKISHRVDPRRLITAGIIISAAGTYACTYYSLMINSWWLIWPLIIQGFGVGMIFVPLSAMVFATLPEKSRIEAAGLNSLLRTLGGSIGIAVTLTVYTRHTQIAWNQLIGFIHPYNQSLVQYARQLHLKPTEPLFATVLGSEITKQATMLSLVSVFVFIVWSFVVMLPFIFFLKYQKQ